MITWPAKYVGLPYEKKGRGPKAYDCWGLVCKVYLDEFEIELPDFGYEATIFDYLRTVEQQKQFFKQTNEPETGDIVLMKIKTAPIHAGIYVEPGWILHSSNETTGSVFERISLWQNQIEGFYKWVY